MKYLAANKLAVESLALHCIALHCQMSIIFSESGLSDIHPPCVVQMFINHNARLFKVFIVGRRRFIIQRPSVKNLSAGGILFISCGFSHFSECS